MSLDTVADATTPTPATTGGRPGRTPTAANATVIAAVHARHEQLAGDLRRDIDAVLAAIRAENELLLHALDDAGVDLEAVLDRPHETAGPAADGGCGCGCGCGHDHEPTPLQIQASDDVRTDELDARTLPHAQRHEIIFARLDRLDSGQSLVIVNDHDPKPLRYQTAAMWPDRFEWTYDESGPERWRVVITRVG